MEREFFISLMSSTNMHNAVYYIQTQEAILKHCQNLAEQAEQKKKK